MDQPKTNTSNIIPIIIILLVLATTAEYDFVVANNNSNGEVIKCKETEREALLKFKDSLIDEYDVISSWGRGIDCCIWEGVQCSNTTGHVIALQLSGNRSSDGYYLEGDISSALLKLHNLNVLDLSDNDFGGNKFPEFICSMTQLQHLNLYRSNFSGTLPPNIGKLTNLHTLNLASNNFYGSVHPQLWNLTNLHSLDLSYNYFFGIVPPQIGSLVNLGTLDLSVNSFSGIIPTQMGNLVNLKTLFLSYNHFSALPLEIDNLTNLETLLLSSNNFSKIVPPQLWGLTNLESLDLSRNSFSDFVHPQLWKLVNLKYIDLSENDLTSSSIDLLFNMGTNHVAPSLTTLNFGSNKLKRFPSSIWKFSKLEVLRVPSNSLEDTITEAHLTKLPKLKDLELSFNSLTLDISPGWTPPFQLTRIDLSGCKLGPHFPSWLQTQSNFSWLDLSNNNISGEVPKWFWTLLDQVDYLNISHNQLSGNIYDYSSIGFIDVSYNKFSGPIPIISPSTFNFQFSQNMFSGSLSFNCSLVFYNLMALDLSSNQLAGKLPICWENMPGLLSLNLAKNSFSGEIPHALGYLSILQNLQLANNNFSGELPITLKNCKHLELIDIRHNMVTGSIPAWIGEYHEMEYLILHNNRFHGIIPPQICYLSFIQVLDFSENNISGKLPICWENMPGLLSLNLAKNSFSGEIPHALGYLSILQNLQLANNNLSGELPFTLKNCKQLRMVDIRDNMLTGSIATWIGEYHETMEYLILHNNRFHGIIPAQICYLSSIRVLDLSGNSISGKIPPCFNNFTYLLDKNSSDQISQDYGRGMSISFPLMIEYTIVLWKRTESEYGRNLKLLKLIDLSNNRLDGNIPRTFSSLKGLYSLNLSRNRFTGIIDPNIGQMSSLECLDLSSNQLSGGIPNGMTQLDFLGVLDLSNNNLSGKIPIGRHLQTLPASSYAGNMGLCGSPLPLCSGDRLDPSTNNEAQNVDEKDGGGILSVFLFKEFGVSIILGFIFGFWGVVGSLIWNESWRRIFYNFFDACGDWLFVRATIFWRKLRRRSS